jgi:hypothetical protein
MGFLRRILGGGSKAGDAPTDTTAHETPADTFDETERERELLREEALRLDDDLIARQLRYADRAWTPPAQGGTRRAEDGDRSGE